MSDLTRMNWSRPAARRTWAAIMAAGGRATTRRIHQQTGSMAVHTDISSLRILLATDHGLDYADRAHYVRRVHLPARTSDSKADRARWAELSPAEQKHAERDVRVVLYVLRGDVRRLWGDLQRAAAGGVESSELRVERAGHNSQLSTHNRGRQGVLFETRRQDI